MTLDQTVRIGVDVGGTNTDAVAIDVALAANGDAQRGVLAYCKTPTTPDATSGIETAVRAVLSAGSGIRPERIASVTVGTTHFLNSVLERDARRLRKVAVVRLSRSFLREVPPFADFPEDLAAILNGYCTVIDGGLHIDGSLEAPVQEKQVVEECAKIKALGIQGIVVAGVFSPIDDHFQQEARVRDIILRELGPSVDVVCSHTVASIGFLERENAAILNASILKYARQTIGRFRLAMKRLKLSCPLFITQNDGTILDARSAQEIPIRTFSSGATNSMRGAAYLAGLDAGGSSAIVVDIGGTTSDVGVILQSGLPRQASAYVTVAGVRVNYSMPHLHSIGLGGGSLVREIDGKVRVGPESVGHFLTEEALVFGGQTCTASDIAVALKQVEMGDASRVSPLHPDFIESARARIKALLDGAIDVIKTSADPMPVLLVGGGAVLAPKEISGASTVIRPPFHDVANAVGAAISRVCGSVDIVQNTSEQTEAQAIQYAKDLAVKRALAAGALESSISIAEVESMPLQYVTNQVRTIVKAVGDVDFRAPVLTSGEDIDLAEIDDTVEEAKNLKVKTIETTRVDPIAYRPRIEKNSEGVSEWILNETDLQWLADGCYVLGCAGGGSPAASFLQIRDTILRAGHKIRVIDHSALKDDALIYWGGYMGSPAVSVERLQSIETVDAFKVLMEYMNHQTIDAVMGLEIGGANGLEPMLVGSTRFFDTPVIDGDWMGRAYPTYWQTTLAVHLPGELVPCAIDSGDGKSIIMTRAPDDEIVDRALRASCSEMGSRVGMAARPTRTEYVRKFGVLNTVSLAWRIGRSIAKCEATNSLSTVAEAIIEEVGGIKAAKVLFRGKIVRVERRLWKGHSHGVVHLASFENDDEDGLSAKRMEALAKGGTMKIPFKNENIYAEHTSSDGNVRIIACVPDLIAILDETGRALGVPEFKVSEIPVISKQRLIPVIQSQTEL